MMTMIMTMSFSLNMDLNMLRVGSPVELFLKCFLPVFNLLVVLSGISDHLFIELWTLCLKSAAFEYCPLLPKGAALYLASRYILSKSL